MLPRDSKGIERGQVSGIASRLYVEFRADAPDEFRLAAYGGNGSDTQRPFAIVIVAGLISRLFIGFFVNPVLYEMVAREGDVLQV